MSNQSDRNIDIANYAEQLNIDPGELLSIMTEISMMIKSRLEYLKMPVTLENVSLLLMPCMEARQKMFDNLLQNPEEMQKLTNKVIDELFKEKS